MNLLTIKTCAVVLLLVGICGSGAAEEVARYRFKGDPLGLDTHGRNSLATDQLLAGRGDGGAIAGSDGHADFSGVKPDADVKPKTVEGLSLNRSHSGVLWVKPGFLAVETGAVRYFFSLGTSVVRLGVMRTDTGAAFFGFSLRRAESEAGAGYITQLRAAPFNARVDRWYQVAYTYDREAELFRFYVDGTLMKEEKVALFKSAPTLFLGWASGSKGFQGALDEVSLFNHALEKEALISY